jgi:3-oxoacyl-[acyl-carrier-protein] synthase II
MAERVVITGMGLICPIGHSVSAAWEALMAGKSGAAPTTIFDATTFPTNFSAEVKGFDLAKFVKTAEQHRHGSRGSRFAVAATAEACRQAGIDIETDKPSDGIDRTRMGIYLGAGEGSADNDAFFASIIAATKPDSDAVDWKAWTAVVKKMMTRDRELEQEANMAGTHLALLAGARGPSRSCLTACAASTQATGEAAMLIRSGKADVMIAGGAHSMIHPLGITGFNRLTALSTRNDSPETASRPFSKSRDGFVIGEGASILILESLTSARKRGATILAELIGYGSSSDAFRVTDMHEDARGASAAIRAAIADAGIAATDIGYINAHGTSTSENDSIETRAIKNVLGEDAKKTPVSSTKSLMGHLIGAAGAAELIISIVGMSKSILPQTANYNDPDPELDLDYVPNAPRKASFDVAMKESFGFGGQNDVVIVRKYSGS